MKRSGFSAKRPPPREATQSSYSPRARAPAVSAVDSRARMVVPVPKRVYVRSPALREAYRLIPCQFMFDGVLCGQADTCCCHANAGIFGKGLGIKADDSRAAAGCPVHHRLLDQGSTWTKHERRIRFWGAHVRSVRLLADTGQWPASIPLPDIDINPFDCEIA